MRKIENFEFERVREFWETSVGGLTEFYLLMNYARTESGNNVIYRWYEGPFYGVINPGKTMVKDEEYLETPGSDPLYITQKRSKTVGTLKVPFHFRNGLVLKNAPATLGINGSAYEFKSWRDVYPNTILSTPGIIGIYTMLAMNLYGADDRQHEFIFDYSVTPKTYIDGIVYDIIL